MSVFFFRTAILPGAGSRFLFLLCPRAFRTARFLATLVLMGLFVSGCSSVGGKSVIRTGEDVYVSIDVPEEAAPDPRLAEDDKSPLTATELAALHSRGELDATLSPAELRLVELHFKYYVHNRSSFERQLKRSELFLPYVKRVFRERGLPEDLAYLAFVESAFNPNAVSRAGACGMWQFMPYTGKRYGLHQDRWLDERRDPFKATRAAADYLAKLYGDFNDWHLAIAAYNAGEGKIGRARTQTGAATFFELCDKNDMLSYKDQLREETRQYVPRFLAVAKIMRNLDRLGLYQPKANKALDVSTVNLPAGVDLRQFAHAIDVDWGQFTGLNPAYRRSISPPDRASVAYVPSARGKRATAWASQKSAGLYAGWRDYKIRPRDSLGAIAHRTGTTTALLRKANDKASNSLRVGEVILVPSSSYVARQTLRKLDPATRSAVTTIAASQEKRVFTPKGTHTIIGGDTLYGIALLHGVSVWDLCEANDIEPTTILSLGRRLVIPAKDVRPVATRQPPEQTPAAKPAQSPVAEAREAIAAGGKGVRYITVAEGDTLYSLAKNNGSTIADICKANNITAKTRLRIGQRLRLEPGVATVSSMAGTQKKEQPVVTTASAKAKVVVQPGDTLYSLALANNTSVAALARHNGINPRTPLQLGQVILLP